MHITHAVLHSIKSWSLCLVWFKGTPLYVLMFCIQAEVSIDYAIIVLIQCVECFMVLLPPTCSDSLRQSRVNLIVQPVGVLCQKVDSPYGTMCIVARPVDVRNGPTSRA